MDLTSAAASSNPVVSAVSETKQKAQDGMDGIISLDRLGCELYCTLLYSTVQSAFR